jgi:hypothetical protein
VADGSVRLRRLRAASAFDPYDGDVLPPAYVIGRMPLFQCEVEDRGRYGPGLSPCTDGLSFF